jgi:cyclic pyranopterin phosphate synthase
MMSEFKTKDRYERPIISLRISITTRCNLNCVYCHHDGMLPSNDEITPDEIYLICKIAKSLGISKIRISGGEPLIRKDIIEIISKIASLNFKDISITTNGTLLEDYALELKNAGLNRANISLDSLKDKTYKFISGKNCLDKVKKGIIKAVEVGLYPVKINMVLMKNINDKEVFDVFKFTKKHGAIYN